MGNVSSHSEQTGTTLSSTTAAADASLLAGASSRKMLSILRDSLGRPVMSMLNTCIHCGICAQECHLYRSTGDPELIPARKVERFSRFLDSCIHPARSFFQFGTKAGEPDPGKIRELFKTAFEDCTLCGKCALACPMGIDTRRILYLARILLFETGHGASGLASPVDTALTMGNYIGLSVEDFIENIEWIGEELAEEIELEDFSIPIDKPDAGFLYVPHPLEVRDFPLLLMASVKILHAAQEDFTFSSEHFDVGNYAYYQGNLDGVGKIVQHLLAAREKIRSRNVVLSPCGHGYRVMRWDAERLLGMKFQFPVFTMVELIDRYLKADRIRFRKDIVKGPVTFHDPCNIARLGGVVQEPRNVLKALTSDFVEMQPCGARNYCCGGGGGLSASADYGKLRMTTGKTKADQLRETGAKTVVTGCYNCMTQIRELNKTYGLGIEVKSIVELVADALIL